MSRYPLPVRGIALILRHFPSIPITLALELRDNGAGRTGNVLEMEPCSTAAIHADALKWKEIPADAAWLAQLDAAAH